MTQKHFLFALILFLLLGGVSANAQALDYEKEDLAIFAKISRLYYAFQKRLQRCCSAKNR